MATLASHKHFIGIFVQWYLWMEPLRLVKEYLAYARALLEIIPFGFLVLTLLRPWKNIQERRMEHGFNLDKSIQRLALNLLSRAVGLVVRLIAIAIGILAHVLLLIAAVAYLAVWFLFPVLTILGVAFLFKTLL